MSRNLAQQMDAAFMNHVRGWVDGLNEICADESVTTLDEAKLRVTQFISAGGGTITATDLTHFANVIVADDGHFVLEGSSLIGRYDDGT